MAAVPSGAAATAGERGVSLSACVLQRWRHSMGSHCRSHDCLPKYCLCGSSLRTSDTGSPNTHYLGRVRSPRTIGPGKPGPAVARKTNRQDQRWQLNKCGSSSTSVLPEPAHFHVNAARNKLPFGAPSGHPVRPFGCPLQKPTCAAQKVMSALPSKADICGATRDIRFVPKAVRSLPIRSGFDPSPLEFTVSAQARDAWDQISTVVSKIAWQLRRPEHRAPCFCNGDAPTQSVSCQFQYPDQAVLEQRPNL